MEQTEMALQVAKGISEYGILIVIASFFLIFAIGVLVWNMVSYKNLTEKIFTDFGNRITDIQDKANKNLETMVDIAEGLVPETQLRVKNTSSVYFDLSVEKVCRMIKRIREENHISDKEATKKKILTLVTNLHEDRNTRFDSYRYRGKRLSEYTNRDWIKWVEKVIEDEIYNESGPNNSRAYTNVSAVYDNIKVDFYRRLNNK